MNSSVGFNSIKQINLFTIQHIVIQFCNVFKFDMFRME